MRNWASHCMKAYMGNEITRVEAIELVRKNQKEGLVLQPANWQEPQFVCSCCKRSCGKCIEACPSKARYLERRKKDMVPPKTFDDLYNTIMENKKGPLGKLGVAVKMMLRV